LIEEYDTNGNITTPSGMSFFHFALEVEGNELEDIFAFTKQANTKGYQHSYGPVRHNDVPPHGDGETGGNVYNNVEFCGAMDTIENYKNQPIDNE